MLKCSLILYSRTKTDDYRWIFSNHEVNSIAQQMLSEYDVFEMNRETYIAEKEILYKKLGKGSLFYSFIDINKIDLSGRKIYGLVGCYFFEEDVDFVNSLFPYFICYFRQSNFLHEIYTMCIETDEQLLREAYIDLNMVFEIVNIYNNEFWKIQKDFPSMQIEHYQFPQLKSKIIDANCNVINQESVKQHILDNQQHYDGVAAYTQTANIFRNNTTAVEPQNNDTIRAVIYLNERQHKILFRKPIFHFSTNTQIDVIAEKLNVSIVDNRDHIVIIGHPKHVSEAEKNIKSLLMKR